jgi:hypothetical protein
VLIGSESNVRFATSTEGLTNRRDQGVTGFLKAVGVRCKSLSLSRRNRTAFCPPANSRQGSAFPAVTPRLFAGFCSFSFFRFTEVFHFSSHSEP